MDRRHCQRGWQRFRGACHRQRRRQPRRRQRRPPCRDVFLRSRRRPGQVGIQAGTAARRARRSVDAARRTGAIVSDHRRGAHRDPTHQTQQRDHRGGGVIRADRRRNRAAETCAENRDGDRDRRPARLCRMRVRVHGLARNPRYRREIASHGATAARCIHHADTYSSSRRHHVIPAAGPSRRR